MDRAMHKHLTTPMDSYWSAVFYSHPLIIWYKKQASIMELVDSSGKHDLGQFRNFVVSVHEEIRRNGTFSRVLPLVVISGSAPNFS